MLNVVHLNICKCERDIDELGTDVEMEREIDELGTDVEMEREVDELETDAERERAIESRSGEERDTNVIARD